MKQSSKKFLSLVLAAVLSVTLLAQNAFAAEQPPRYGKNSVTFSNLSSVAPDSCLTFDVKDSNGNPATVGIERAPRSRSAGETWRVWFNGISINAEFYMTVSNNRVTSVFDDRIVIVGGSYDNDVLTKTSTYGKLTFDYTSLGSILSSSCWLKGTVTGSDDEITVDWQM